MPKPPQRGPAHTLSIRGPAWAPPSAAPRWCPAAQRALGSSPSFGGCRPGGIRCLGWTPQTPAVRVRIQTVLEGPSGWQPERRILENSPSVLGVPSLEGWVGEVPAQVHSVTAKGMNEVSKAPTLKYYSIWEIARVSCPLAKLASRVWERPEHADLCSQPSGCRAGVRLLLSKTQCQRWFRRVFIHVDRVLETFIEGQALGRMLEIH